MEKFRKTMLAALGMVAAAGMLGACAQTEPEENSRPRIGDSANEKAEEGDDKENGTEKPGGENDNKPEATPTVAEEPSAEEIYFVKLYELYGSLRDVDEALMNGGEDLYWLADFRYTAESVGGSVPELVGYAITDLSGDGVPELILASEAITEWDLGMNIHNIYTIKDGECVLVVQGWGRNRQYLLKSGELYNEGSSGASESSHGMYRLSKDGTEEEWTDFCFSTYNGTKGEIEFYHNTTGEWDADASELLQIDEGEFWQIREDYEKQITDLKLTRLSELAEMGNCVEAQYAEDYKGDASKLDHYDTCNDPYEREIVITTSEDITDFEVHSVMFDDSDGPVGGFTTAPIETIGSVKANEPIVISAAFPGSMPNYAAAYTDKNGIRRILYFTQSGRDGSLEVDVRFVF
ncbi:MAG: hypothetical protein J6O73_17430 [Lachnospiraceae bacterium]|nr:hypothetical protein [Lachnospiraceae bacterium]